MSSSAFRRVGWIIFSLSDYCRPMPSHTLCCNRFNVYEYFMKVYKDKKAAGSGFCQIPPPIVFVELLFRLKRP
jgi:hypothetical protein